MDTELASPHSDMEVVEDNFPASCIHITNYKSEFVLDDYRNLYSFYVSCISKERKINDCVCHEQSCGTNRTRIHACLYCIYFGCFNSKFSHINHHARSNNHPLGMDTDSGHVFCFECNDYIHDFDFEKIRQEQNLITSHQIGITTCATNKWEPNLDEINLLAWHEIVHDSKSDIRGFANINSSICFMIAVIQTFLHAPAFRDYLLSFKHKCKVKEKTDYPTCFICEMAKIMQECISGNSKPYYMTDFLTLTKDRLKKFATTTWHDADEFFLNFLSKLREDCEDCEATPTRPTGPLKVSDVTAKGCKLKWGKPEDQEGIAGYTVEKLDTSTGKWVPVGRIDKTEMDVKDLTPGKEYQFRVKAINPEGVSKPLVTDRPTLAKNPYVTEENEARFTEKGETKEKKPRERFRSASDKDSVDKEDMEICEEVEQTQILCNCIIHTTFELSWLTEYTCYKCKKRKPTISPVHSRWNIVLSNLGEEVISLTDCFKSVLLEDARCDSCSEKSVGSKKFVLKKLPMVLTFVSYMNYLQGIKTNYKEFLNVCPENVKDGDKWEVSENPEYQYYLFSVIEYYPGHYKVYIRKDKNKWFLCDCGDTKPIEQKKILSLQNAMMLFYHKQFP